MVGKPEATRGRSGGTIDQLAPETFASGSDWRTRSNCVRSRIDVRLCAHDQERSFCKTDPRLGQEVFSGGQKLPAQLRTFGRRFSFTLSGRSRRDAAGASAKRIRELVEGIHAADPSDGKSRLAESHGFA